MPDDMTAFQRDDNTEIIKADSRGTGIAVSAALILYPFEYYQKERLLTPELVEACYSQNKIPSIPLIKFCLSYFQAVVRKDHNQCWGLNHHLVNNLNFNIRNSKYLRNGKWRFRSRESIDTVMNDGKEISLSLSQMTYFIQKHEFLDSKRFHLSTVCGCAECSNPRHLIITQNGNRQHTPIALVVTRVGNVEI